MLRYPVLLQPDTNGTVLVSFPDFPEAHTFGDDEHEALARAADLLQDVLADYIESRRDVPEPSRVKAVGVADRSGLRRPAQESRHRDP